jgi:hypothetical protein
VTRETRNLVMAERIGGSPVRSPFAFVIAGNSGGHTRFIAIDAAPSETPEGHLQFGD